MINSQFKSREYKRAVVSLTGKCNDMKHYHNTGTTNLFQVMVIACAERSTSANANIYVYFYDPIKNSVTSLKRAIVGEVKFETPMIRFSKQTTSLGINRPYAVIVNELNRNVYSAFKGTIKAQVFKPNLDIIFVDITAKTVSALSLKGKVDLDIVVDFAPKNNRIFLAGYKQTGVLLTSRRARIYDCPISSSLSATNCVLKNTGFFMTAGGMKIGVDTKGNDDRLYFYEDSLTKQIVGVCQLNLLSTTG